jgi:hypothetical protein
MPDSCTSLHHTSLIPHLGPKPFSGHLTDCLAGAYLFPSEDAPKYLLGFGVIAGMMAFGVMVYALAHVLFRKYIQ